MGRSALSKKTELAQPKRDKKESTSKKDSKFISSKSSSKHSKKNDNARKRDHESKHRSRSHHTPSSDHHRHSHSSKKKRIGEKHTRKHHSRSESKSKKHAKKGRHEDSISSSPSKSSLSDVSSDSFSFMSSLSSSVQSSRSHSCRRAGSEGMFGERIKDAVTAATSAAVRTNLASQEEKDASLDANHLSMEDTMAASLIFHQGNVEGELGEPPQISEEKDVMTSADGLTSSLCKPSKGNIKENGVRFVSGADGKMEIILSGSDSSLNALTNPNHLLSVGGNLNNTNTYDINKNGTLSLFREPLCSDEMRKQARENRRIHVSGFPREVTRLIIMQCVSSYMTILRRERTLAEMEELESTNPKPSETVICNIDKPIGDPYLDMTKDKPYAFVELNTDDMAEMMVEAGLAQRIKLTLHDGRTYILRINRPREYMALDGLDNKRVVIQGITQAMPEKVLKELCEVAGTVTAFQLKDNCCYVEYENEHAAMTARKDFHGLVVRNTMIVCYFLTDVMRAYFVGIGFDIRHRQSIEDERKIFACHRDLMLEMLEERSSLYKILRELHTMGNDKFPHLVPFLGSVLPVQPTRILALLNIVDKTDLETDESYDNFRAYIAEGIEPYGAVKRLIIPRMRLPPPPSIVKVEYYADEDEKHRLTEQYEVQYQLELSKYHQARNRIAAESDHPILGAEEIVFVEYERVEEAAAAQAGLRGRLFCNRTVVTSFVFEDLLYPKTEEEGEIERVREEMEEVIKQGKDEEEIDNYNNNNNKVSRDYFNPDNNQENNNNNVQQSEYENANNVHNKEGMSMSVQEGRDDDAENVDVNALLADVD